MKIGGYVDAHGRDNSLYVNLDTIERLLLITIGETGKNPGLSVGLTGPEEVAALKGVCEEALRIMKHG